MFLAKIFLNHVSTEISHFSSLKKKLTIENILKLIDFSTFKLYG
jgi:hypothetical protein